MEDAATTSSTLRAAMSKTLTSNSSFRETPSSKAFIGHSNLITCLTSFFWKKNPVRLQKKKEKSRLWCLTDESGLEIFCQTPKKKKKSARFKNIHC